MENILKYISNYLRSFVVCLLASKIESFQKEQSEYLFRILIVEDDIGGLTNNEIIKVIYHKVSRERVHVP